MKNILAAFLLLLCFNLNAQFRASVECEGFVLVSDSTYTGNINKFTDQTNEGFLTTGIKQGYVLVDANFRGYRINTINSTSFSDANVTVTSLKGIIAPTQGKGQITEDLKEKFYAVTPDNQEGITPVLR
jgi:hypothetical protein